jgi:hypothetical protein
VQRLRAAMAGSERISEMRAQLARWAARAGTLGSSDFRETEGDAVSSDFKRLNIPLWTDAAA